jgi:two-component system, OmpR family, alkaline phosphatase synthesis response regulator PhoP
LSASKWPLTSMNARLLIVEDEAALITTLRDRLHKEGYDVSVARDGNAGLEAALKDVFDLVILDVMLPGQGGLSVCQKLRSSGSKVPILMLTARRQTIDKVAGLRTGADDYLTKPFQMAELLARVDALIRRSAHAFARDQYRFDSFTVDFRKPEIRRDGHLIPMSAKELQLLRYFIEHPDATISRDELLREVWGYDVVPSSRTVDVHVAGLRQKLENDPRNPVLISTIVGLGYKFTARGVRPV